MITVEQCRAARGLLGWTQQDLAHACGLSKTAVNNYEKGHSDIKTESLRAIRMAFEGADIEFLGAEGLRKRGENIKILKGPDAMSELLDDIFETLKDCGGEVLISHMSQAAFAQVPAKKLAQHRERLKDHNITERILCRQGTLEHPVTADSCRWISHDIAVSAMAAILYGEKLALQLWDHAMIVVINSRDAYNTERRRFEYLWNSAEIPPQGRKTDHNEAHGN